MQDLVGMSDGRRAARWMTTINSGKGNETVCFISAASPNRASAASFFVALIDRHQLRRAPAGPRRSRSRSCVFRLSGMVVQAPARVRFNDMDFEPSSGFEGAPSGKRRFPDPRLRSWRCILFKAERTVSGRIVCVAVSGKFTRPQRTRTKKQGVLTVFLSAAAKGSETVKFGKL